MHIMMGTLSYLPSGDGGEGRLDRTTPVSLTIRYVPKTFKIKLKLKSIVQYSKIRLMYVDSYNDTIMQIHMCTTTILCTLTIHLQK